jgi:hypothetical protein
MGRGTWDVGRLGRGTGSDQDNYLNQNIKHLSTRAFFELRISKWPSKWQAKREADLFRTKALGYGLAIAYALSFSAGSTPSKF